MASPENLYDDEMILISFHQKLGEELERLKDVRNIETRSKILKKLQIQMFDTALKMSFELKGH